MRFKSQIVIALILVSGISATAQSGFSGFPQDDLIASDSGKLQLNLSAAAFFENNEFTGNIVKGYTLPGFYVQPTAVASLSPKTRVSAGFHGLFYGGREKFDKVVPVLRIEHQLTSSIKMVGGTLIANGNHGLPEPVYNPERFFINQPETGVQFLKRSSQVDADLWINWENFIEHGDSVQERFTMGFSSVFKASPTGIYFPVFFVAHHAGGQINAGNDTVQTIANIGVGFGYRYALDSRKAWLGAEVLFIHSGDFSPMTHMPFAKGYAVYPRVMGGYKSLLFEMGYWNASGFLNPRGEPIFGSISTVNKIYNEKRRELLTTKLMLKHNYTSGLSISAGIETYYDFSSSTLEYAYCFRMVLDRNFFIGMIR